MGTLPHILHQIGKAFYGLHHRLTDFLVLIPRQHTEQPQKLLWGNGQKPLCGH